MKEGAAWLAKIFILQLAFHKITFTFQITHADILVIRGEANAMFCT